FTNRTVQGFGHPGLFGELIDYPVKITAWNDVTVVFKGSADFAGGSPEATRRAFNKRFLLDLPEDWQQHGREGFKRGRPESPAAYVKVCGMLVPREMKLEHSGGVKAMTTEQIERGIELIKEMLAEREAEANAKVIEGEAMPSLPAPTAVNAKSS